MSYRADKQVIDTHTDRYAHMGDDNTRRPKLLINQVLSPAHKHRLYLLI